MSFTKGFKRKQFLLLAAILLVVGVVFVVSRLKDAFADSEPSFNDPTNYVVSTVLKDKIEAIPDEEAMYKPVAGADFSNLSDASILAGTGVTFSLPKFQTEIEVNATETAGEYKAVKTTYIWSQSDKAAKADLLGKEVSALKKGQTVGLYKVEEEAIITVSAPATPTDAEPSEDPMEIAKAESTVYTEKAVTKLVGLTENTAEVTALPEYPFYAEYDAAVEGAYKDPIEGKMSDASSGQFVYGQIEYAVVPAGTDADGKPVPGTLTGYSASKTLAALMQSKTRPDGIYTIGKRYVVKSANGQTTYIIRNSQEEDAKEYTWEVTEEKDLLIEFSSQVAFKASLDQTLPEAAGTRIDAVGLDPATSFTVSYTANCETTLEVKKGTDTVLVEKKGEKDTPVSFETPVESEQNNARTMYYYFTITGKTEYAAGKVAEKSPVTYVIKAKFDDIIPVIESVSIQNANDKEPTLLLNGDSVFLLGKNDTESEVTIKIQNRDKQVEETPVTLYYLQDGVEKVSAVLEKKSGEEAGVYTYKGVIKSSSEEAGSKTYYVRTKARSDEFSAARKLGVIIYDDMDPTIKDVSIRQENSSNNVVAYGEEDKITANKDYVVRVPFENTKNSNGTSGSNLAKIVVTPEHAGITATYDAVTYVNNDSVDEISALAGKIDLNVSRSDAVALHKAGVTKEKYTVQISDAAGNSTEREFTVQFFADEIQISSSVEAEKSTQTLKETIFGAKDFKVTYKVVTDVKLRSNVSLSVTTSRDGIEKITDETASSMKLLSKTVPTEVGEDGMYTYEFVYSLRNSETIRLEDLTFNVTNINGVKQHEGSDFDAVKNDVTSIINIDANKPIYTIENSENPDETMDILQSKWYQHLYLNVYYSEDSEGLPAEAVSGIDKIEILNGSGANMITADGSKDSVEVDVVESRSLEGTPVKITVTDKVGNINSGKYYFHVDKTQPVVSLTVDGTSAETIDGKVVESDGSADPEIAFTVRDNLAIDKFKLLAEYTDIDGKVVEKQVSLDAAEMTEEGFASVSYAEKLSKIFGTAAAKEGFYTVTLQPADYAGNRADTLTASFIVDNTAPMADIRVEDEYADSKSYLITEDKLTYKNSKTGVSYNYNKYFAGSVRVLNLEVKDLNPNPEGVEILVTKNGGTPKREIISADKWTEMKDANGHVIGITCPLEVKNDGEYTVTIKATDMSGLVSAEPEGQSQTVSFVIDTKNPVISIANFGNINGQYLKSTVTLTAYVQDANEDTKDLSIEGTRIDPVTGETVTLKNYKLPYTEAGQYTSETYTEDGYYEFKLTAIDKAGNKNTKEISFTLDNEAPVVDVLILNPMDTEKEFDPVVNHYKNDVSGKEYDYLGFYSKDITLKFTSTDYNNQENGAGIIIYDELDGERKTVVPDADWTVEEGSKATLINTYVVSEEGAHKIMIRANDKSGHASVWKTVSFVIDKTNPVISSSVSTPELKPETEATQYIDKAPAFELTVDDKNEDIKDLQVKTVRVNEDKSVETLPLRKAIASDGTYKAPDNWFDVNGEYEIVFTAVDKSGRKSAPVTYRFTVDKTNPLADIVINENSRINAAKTGEPSTYENFKTGVKYNYDKYFNQNITMDLSLIDYNIDMSTVRVVDVDENGEEKAVEVGEWTTTTTDVNGKKVPTVTATISIAKENEGFHKIVLSAVDYSGRSVSAPAVAFTVDNTAPVITLNLNQLEKYADMQKYLPEDAVVQAFVEDTNEDTSDFTMNYVLTEAGKTAANQAISAKRTYTDGKYAEGIFTKEGYYVVNYTAVDKAGNTTTNTIGFTVDKSVPIVDVAMKNPESAAKIEKEQSTYENTESGMTYIYGKYFNQNVVLDFSAADYNNKDNAADIQIKDSVNGGLPVDVELSGEWIADSVNLMTENKLSLPAYKNSAVFSEEGVHNVTITSTDKAGNKATLQKVEFEIDKTNPVIDLSLNEEVFKEHRFLLTNGITEVKVTDKNKDTADLTISVKEIPSDGSDPISTVEKTSEGTKEYVNDSRYEISYTAVDLAGNTSTKSMAFTVDKTKPVAEIMIQNPMNAAKAEAHNQTYSNPTTGTQYKYAQYFNHSVRIQFTVRDFNAAVISVTDNGRQILSLSDFRPSANGVLAAEAEIEIADGDEVDHEIVLTSVDKSGAESERRSVNFTLDRRSPGISASLNGSSFPSGATETYLATDGTVSVYVDETNKDTTDLVRTAKVTQPSASQAVSAANVGEGAETFSTEADYSIEYVATDLAGNVSGTYVVNFRVDKTAPNLSIDGVVAGSTSNKNVTVNYNMIEAFYWDMPNATVSIYKKLDGRGETLLKTINYTAGSSNSVQSETFEEDGEYRFDFVAEDKAGNKANTSFMFIMDKTAPVIILKNMKEREKAKEPVTLEITIVEDFFASNKVTLSGEYKDIDGKTHKIDFDDYNANAGRTSEISQEFKEDGIYHIVVTSTDRGSNETKKELNFTIDQTDPEINDLSAYISESMNKFEFDVNADDLVKDLTVTDVTLYIDGVAYDGVSTPEDGTHVLRVVAEDELGHKSESEISFLLDTKAPNIIITGVDTGAFVEEPVTITISVQIDEDTLNWVTVNGEKKQIVDGKSCTFTVDTPGNYVIDAEAIDKAGNIGSLETYFNYGKKFNWWTVIAGCGAAAVLGILLIIIGAKRRKKEKQ